LLGELAATSSRRRRIGGLARMMAKAGWVWGPEVLAALESGGEISQLAGIGVWEDLPEWQDQAPEPAPSDLAVEPAEARRRLADLLGPRAEQRPQQADYAEALTPAFAPRPAEDAPNVVLAEAGTGVGKTLGYLSPAGLWAERNKAAVWVSTFTRHLQNQIDQELDRLYPNPAAKAARVVLRKGRENYLCLLNLADLAGTAAVRTQDAVAFGLMARWVMATRDGDLAGGDLPGWLPDILGPNRVGSLADRRGDALAIPALDKFAPRRLAGVGLMHHATFGIGMDGLAGSAGCQMPGGVALPVVKLAAHLGDLDATMPLMDRSKRRACLDGLQLLRVADQHDLCAGIGGMGQNALHLARADHARFVDHQHIA